MITDLGHSHRLQPEQAAAYLRHVASDDWVCHFEIVSADSVCRLAHRNSVSETARVNGAAARVVRDLESGQFKPAKCEINGN